MTAGGDFLGTRSNPISSRIDQTKFPGESLWGHRIRRPEGAPRSAVQVAI